MEARGPSPFEARKSAHLRVTDYATQSTINSFAPVFVDERCAASPKSDTW